MLLKAQLKVNDEELDISGFSFKTPPNVMGQSVTLALTTPNINAISEDSTIEFFLGAGNLVEGAPVYSMVRLLQAGRVFGQSNNINWISDERGGKPGDICEIDLMSPLGDKWALCPAAPITMYDPVKVDGSTLMPNNANLPRIVDPITGGYQLIYPALEPVSGLSLWKALDRAYTNNRPALAPEANALSAILGRSVYDVSRGAGTGIGFAKVITNVPDIPIDTASFGYEGWNAGAAALLTNYKTEVFEVDNILYIICPFFPLPPGFTPKVLNLRCVISVNLAKNPSEITNGAFMSYKILNGSTNITGAIPSIRFVDEEPRITGAGVSYSRTEISRRLVEYKLGTQIVHTEETDITTRVYAYRPNITIASNADGDYERNVQGGDVKLISEETLTNSYQGKLKTGYERTTKATYPDPNQLGAPDTYGQVKKETCRQTWASDMNNPGEFILSYSEIITEGLCLVEEQEVEFTDDPSGKKFKYINKVYTPILEANNQFLITGDPGTQYTENKTLTTKTEELRDNGFNQTDVLTTVIDNINGVILSSEVQPRTGSTGTYNPAASPSANGSVITEFITDKDSIQKYGLRKPLRIDIGYLSPVLGRKLVAGIIKQTSNPPRSVNIEIPGVDFSIRRGSIVVPPYREGSSGVMYLVRGSTITGRALGTPAAWINQTLECIELISYE
jgi:hypothetical protein